MTALDTRRGRSVAGGSDGGGGLALGVGDGAAVVADGGAARETDGAAVVADGGAIAGIDIGGTTTHAVLVEPDGRVIASRSASTPAKSGGQAMVETSARLVEEMISGQGRRLAAVGVGAAGIVDWPGGVVSFACDSFTDWTGFPLARALTKRLGVDAVADNDVNAFLLGEATWGAARGCDDVLGVTLGTGVGGALLLEGRLYRGGAGWAGELGHVAGFSDLPCTCGQAGHLETLAGGRAVVARYRAAGAPSSAVPASADSSSAPSPSAPASAPSSAAAVADLARAGDPHARLVFDDAGAALGKALAMASTLLDISRAVIGGGLTGAWDLLAPAVARQLAATPPVSGHAPDVVVGELGDLAVARGAAALALSKTPLGV